MGNVYDDRHKSDGERVSMMTSARKPGMMILRMRFYGIYGKDVMRR